MGFAQQRVTAGSLHEHKPAAHMTGQNCVVMPSSWSATRLLELHCRPGLVRYKASNMHDRHCSGECSCESVTVMQRGQAAGAEGADLAVDASSVLLWNVGQGSTQVLVLVAEAHVCFCTAETSQIPHWKLNLHCKG